MPPQVMEQLDPEAGIEEEYKLTNDKAYCWKALRLMAKKDVSLLSKVGVGVRGWVRRRCACRKTRGCAESTQA